MEYNEYNRADHEEVPAERADEPRYRERQSGNSEGRPYEETGHHQEYAPPPPPAWWRSRRSGCLLPLLALLGALLLGTLFGSALCQSHLLPALFANPFQAVLCGSAGGHGHTGAHKDASSRHPRPAPGAVPGQGPAPAISQSAGSPPPPRPTGPQVRTAQDRLATPWWCHS